MPVAVPRTRPLATVAPSAHDAAEPEQGLRRPRRRRATAAAREGRAEAGAGRRGGRRRGRRRGPAPRPPPSSVESLSVITRAHPRRDDGRPQRRAPPVERRRARPRGRDGHFIVTMLAAMSARAARQCSAGHAADGRVAPHNRAQFVEGVVRDVVARASPAQSEVTARSFINPSYTRIPT